MSAIIFFLTHLGKTIKMAQNTSSCIVSKDELKAFIIRCMVSVGTKTEHAESLAETLQMADYRGHYSHGLNRLEMYVRDIKSGITANAGDPVVDQQTPAIAHVDGKNLLGPVVGYFCMDLAIAKAKNLGIGMVVANNSNHFGIAGAYGLKALEQNVIGMSFTNSSPLVVPTRAKKPAIGTNPICFAAPANNGDSFVLDMATSAVALGKIELQNRKEEPIPEGWGANSSGKLTTDGKEVIDGGALMPLGGAESTSGYKGYGLGMMVETLCGILGNANYGPNIRKWKNTTVMANLGQCFIAIDPEAFTPGFTDRMSDLNDTFRNLESISEDKPVLVAGDVERKHMAECDAIGGIKYHSNQIVNANDLARELNIEPMKLLL